ncbi:MAG: hypothetical protein V8S58_00940 [Lachnospiraceae bacterium]
MREIIQMKYESASDQPNSSNKKLLSWDELLEKGALLKDTIQRLSDAGQALSCHQILHGRNLPEG